MRVRDGGLTKRGRVGGKTRGGRPRGWLTQWCATREKARRESTSGGLLPEIDRARRKSNNRL
jgi:hypothetical protein